MTGAQAIVKMLEKEGAETIFGYPGAAICPFYDALADSDIRHVLTRNEQGAAHAANGYARVTGRTGVCVSTSGPGATNLITGIATAYMDSIPVVAITGQVSTGMIGKDVFQEVDITGATAPFCKHNYLVRDAGRLPRIIREAFYIASTGRPGPVLVDIPLDVQNMEIDFEYPSSVEIKGYRPVYRGNALQIRKVIQALKASEKPVICAGGGIISSGASGRLLEFVEKCPIPVITTLMGIGCVPSDHPLHMGMLGSHGSCTANHAIHNADLVIIAGARVGNRAMGSTAEIARNAVIVHIDIDPAEIGKNIAASIPVAGDVSEVFRQLLQETVSTGAEQWVDMLSKMRREKAFKYEADDEAPVQPRYLLKELSSLMDDEDVITTEVGQNQIWAANHFSVKSPGTFLSSGGLGTMGYGLPAGMGAKFGKPESEVVVISGDGSFQMSLQELGTLKQYGAGIKIVMFNNSSLGMVRELQKKLYCGRCCEVVMDDNPDFIQLMKAYGFKGMRIESNKQVRPALVQMLEEKGTFLLECAVDPDEPTL